MATYDPSSAEAAPSPEPSRRILIVLAATLIAGVTTWMAFLVLTGIRLEDALITYRYAENLARGNGLVFNPGERVLGTSTPLLALALGAAGSLLGVARIPLVCNASMVGCSLGTALLLYWTLRRSHVSPGISCFATALFVFHPDTLWATTGGMETPLVLFLMTLSLYSLVRGRPYAVAVTLAALVLTRADGVVWSGVLLAWDRVSERHLSARHYTAGLLSVAPWLVFAWPYFGSPVPNSITAKHTIGHGHGAADYLAWILNATGYTLEGRFMPLVFAVWAPLLVMGCIGIGGNRRNRALMPLVIFPPIFAAIFCLGKAPTTFPWYALPITVCCLAIGAIGFRECSIALNAYATTRSLRRRVVTIIAAGALALLVVGTAARDITTFSYHRDYQRNEHGARRAVGLWLRDNTPWTAVVAMEAIGYQGTFAQRRIIDLAGLISPEVVAFRRESRSSAGTFYRVWRELRPDYIVLRSFEVDSNIGYHGGVLFETPEQKGEFLVFHREIRRFHAPIPEVWGPHSSVTIYERMER